MRQSLSTVRSTGLAVSREEFEPKTTAVAAPVVGAGGSVVAAIELAQDRGQDIREITPALVLASRWLSRELQAGYHRGHLLISPKRHLDLMILGSDRTSGRRSTRDHPSPHRSSPSYATRA